jgi:hypothetical protein
MKLGVRRGRWLDPIVDQNENSVLLQHPYRELKLVPDDI